MAQNMSPMTMAMNDENLLNMGVEALMSGKVTPDEVQKASKALSGDTSWLENHLAPKADPYMLGQKAKTAKKEPSTGQKKERAEKESKSESSTRTVFLQPEVSDPLFSQIENIPGIKEQREGIAQMEELLSMEMAQPQDSSDAWIKPLLALATAETGKNYMGAYTPVESGDKRRARQTAALDDLQKRKADLSKSILEGVTKLKAGTDTTQQNQSMQNTIAMLSGALAGGRRDGGLELTPFEKKRDVNFANRYGEFLDEGGFAAQEQDFETMKNMVNDLETKEGFTGPTVGALPGAIRKFTHPESWDQQQTYERVIQKSLKRILGGQFAEREARELFRRSYDPALPQAANAKRIKSAFNEIQKAYEAFSQAARYVEQNGTLKGYMGARNITINGNLYSMDNQGVLKPQGGSSGGDGLDTKKKRLEELRAKQRGG